MVQVTVGGRGQLQSTEADVVKSLVVDTVGLVGVFDELMDREGSVIRLYDRVRHLQYVINQIDILSQIIRYKRLKFYNIYQMIQKHIMQYIVTALWIKNQ